MTVRPLGPLTQIPAGLDRAAASRRQTSRSVGQQGAKWPEIQVEVARLETEVLPQLGHRVLEVHQPLEGIGHRFVHREDQVRGFVPFPTQVCGAGGRRYLDSASRLVESQGLRAEQCERVGVLSRVRPLYGTLSPATPRTRCTVV